MFSYHYSDLNLNGCLAVRSIGESLTTVTGFLFYTVTPS